MAGQCGSSIEPFRCKPYKLPSKLYRVQYPGTQVQRDHSGGLKSAGRQDFYSSKFWGDEALKAVLEDNLDWQCRRPSPFINVFGNLIKAKQWAKRRSRRFRVDCKILEIDTVELVARSRWIGKLATMANALDIDLRVPKLQADEEHAYLILYNVPREAIGRSWDITARGSRQMEGVDEDGIVMSIEDDVEQPLDLGEGPVYGEGYNDITPDHHDADPNHRQAPARYQNRRAGCTRSRIRSTTSCESEACEPAVSHIVTPDHEIDSGRSASPSIDAASTEIIEIDLTISDDEDPGDDSDSSVHLQEVVSTTSRKRKSSHSAAPRKKLSRKTGTSAGLLQMSYLGYWEFDPASASVRGSVFSTHSAY